jgi:hypothetical protein
MKSRELRMHGKDVQQCTAAEEGYNKQQHEAVKQSGRPKYSTLWAQETKKMGPTHSSTAQHDACVHEATSQQSRDRVQQQPTNHQQPPPLTVANCCSTAANCSRCRAAGVWMVLAGSTTNGVLQAQGMA